MSVPKHLLVMIMVVSQGVSTIHSAQCEGECMHAKSLEKLNSNTVVCIANILQ